MEVGNIYLRDYQVEHFNNLCNIFLKYHCAIDTSPTGSGKSYVSASLISHFNFPHVIIICPKSVKVSWDEVIKTTGIKINDIMTYQSLRGQAGKPINHGYLERIDRSGETTLFYPTDKLRDLINEGVLIIFDEVQNIKNTSEQLKAAKAMISVLLTTQGTTSRVLFLSGSPFDKEEHSINFMRALGFIRHRNLYTNSSDTGELKLQGAEELINVCRHSFNKEITDKIIKETDIDRKNITSMCYRLFCEVLKPKLFSSMSPPPIKVTKDIKNGYYKIQDPQKLIEAINLLGKVAKYRKETMDVNTKEADWGAITIALMKIEEAKIPIFVRLAKEKLIENDKNQVIILVNYTNNLIDIRNHLKDFKPMLMNGLSTDKQRSEIIKNFQNGNQRLLIANMKVGGVGINLHDKIGLRPRYMFASPNYMAIDMHQATGRVHREGTLSKPVIRFVYGLVGLEETSILNALAKKKAVLETILDKQVKSGIVFPGAYENELEY
jgi:superfamily II DNA or RNA helicase